MILTDQSLCDLYLKDLEFTKITYNNIEHPKVKKIGSWKQFRPITKHAGHHPIPLDGSVRVWTWSDQHFGHKNIIRYTGRPFDNVEQMNQTLVDNYLANVSIGDIVIFGGDVIFGNHSIFNEMFEMFPGYKILILGNHDLRHGAYTHLAFDEIVLSKVMYYRLPNGNYINIAYTHIPITQRPTDIEQHTLFFHGHIHQKITNKDHDVNVCVEHTNYSPVLMTERIDMWVNWFERNNQPMTGFPK